MNLGWKGYIHHPRLKWIFSFSPPPSFYLAISLLDLIFSARKSKKLNFFLASLWPLVCPIMAWNSQSFWPSFLPVDCVCFVSDLHFCMSSSGLVILHQLLISSLAVWGMFLTLNSSQTQLIQPQECSTQDLSPWLTVGMIWTGQFSMKWGKIV